MLLLKHIQAQDEAVGFLRHAMAADRLPHGFIFAGPMGVGKSATAVALGAWLLCDKPTSSDACGKCASCRLVAASTHPDLHIITREMARLHDKSGTSKATALAINVIRNELAAPAARKTVMGRAKIFIVEEAHLMTPAAQNAMLKTLEEPAGRTLIVLITNQEDDLLSTIRSRCQVLHFGAMPHDLVVQMLKDRNIDAKTAVEAADLADGSIGIALRWIEDGMIAPARSVSTQVDAAAGGKSPFDLVDLVKKLAEAQTELGLKRDELASKDALMRANLTTFLGVAARQLRRRLADAQEDEEMDRLCQAVEAVADAEKFLDANVNTPLTLEQLATNLQFAGPSLNGF